MALTSAQVKQYEKDGFLPYGPLLSLREVNNLLVHYADLFAKANSRNIREVQDGETKDIVLQITGAYEKDGAFGELVRHPRILDIAESLLGPNIQVYTDQALLKPAFHGGEVPWHQDNAYWKCDPADLVTCWIALGDVAEDNGAMRFIPGSHVHGAVEHKRGFEGTVMQEVQADVSNAITVELPAGGCSWHHCLTLHNTKPNITPNPRPGIAIAYMRAGTKDRDGKVMREKPVVRGSF